MSAVDLHIYEMAGYANAGLDDPLNLTLLQNESELNSSYTSESLDWINVPSEATKLHRSLEDYSEKLAEFNAKSTGRVWRPWGGEG